LPAECRAVPTIRICRRSTSCSPPDKNGDGALSRAEVKSQFKDFFDNQDTNKDGKISRDEWK
jgi:hypothetical protein